MRRRLAAALLAPLLLLAACSGEDSAGPTSTSSSTATTAGDAQPTKADIAALAAVKLTGAVGSEPTATFDKPFSITAAVARVETEGTGDTLASGQTVELNLVGINGDDGTVTGSTFGANTEKVTLGSANLYEAMNKALIGQKVGVRVLFAIPGGTDTTATASPAKTPATIWVMEVVSAKSLPTRAEGEAVTPAAGLPTVKLADNGEPSITPVSTPAPTSLVTQTLIKGAGAAVASGQSITVQYAGWLWDGTSFDKSWGGDTMTTKIGVNQVIAGWDQGLVGQTVGSQVLLVIPPSLAYGDTAKAKIPAGSTLIFVVDILDAA